MILDSIIINKKITATLMWFGIIFIGITIAFSTPIWIPTTLAVFSIIMYFTYLYFVNKQKTSYNQHNVEITVGKIDKDGFAETYKDGIKTNVKILLFNKNQSEQLSIMMDNAYKNIQFKEERKEKVKKL